MNNFLRKWAVICLFNLLLVSILGCVMRYKIILPLKHIDQKNLLHTHSHFAFAGWITQALFCFLVNYLKENGIENAYKKYKPILFSNLLTAYAMFLTFPFTGYSLPSIFFSTLSIFISYWFAIVCWKDLTNIYKNQYVVAKWFKAALSFLCLSSAGTFSLAFITASHQANTHLYLLSVYFFLHFQYNGWFLFACMGLFTSLLLKNRAKEYWLRKTYFLFVTSCIPAYLLSALWLPLGKLMYIIIIIAVIFQLVGWGIVVSISRKSFNHFSSQNKSLSHLLCILIMFAMSSKLLLQAGSAIPSLSKLAFSIRPIVIGYLHLVLLGIISLFLFLHFLQTNAIHFSKTFKTGLYIFIAGIILNELFLMTQGLTDIWLSPQPFINTVLFYISLMLVAGISIVNISQWTHKVDSTHILPKQEN